VGAAVLGRDGQVVGAISVSGPAFSVPDPRVSELGCAVAGTALRISRGMGYTGPAPAGVAGGTTG